MAITNAYLHGNADSKDTLVVVFLRGGADGLNMVVPIEDDDYYRARPLIGISKTNTVSLDGFFGLNPHLSPLKGAYDAGDLAIIHQAGSEDLTRSHFEAQDSMEHGGFVGGGWLGRYLRAHRQPGSGPLSAVALGKTKPLCMWGAPTSVVMESFDVFSMAGTPPNFLPSLAELYKLERNPLGRSGKDAFKALNKIEQLSMNDYEPAGGATYPGGSFGHGLQQIAQLIKSRVGLQAATIDLGGWDSHFATTTLMDPLMRQLGSGLAAFYSDMAQHMEDVTVVVMTEFGRRVAQNVSMGTDHGRGGVLFALGGGIQGGQVIHQWQGLSREKLEGPGDLPVVHNYRNVLASILHRHGASNSLDTIFPNFNLEPISLHA